MRSYNIDIKKKKGKKMTRTCPECGEILDYYNGCECGLSWYDADEIAKNEADQKW